MKRLLKRTRINDKIIEIGLNNDGDLNITIRKITDPSNGLYTEVVLGEEETQMLHYLLAPYVKSASTITPSSYSPEFFKFFIGMEFNPDNDELFYLYPMLNATEQLEVLEEEHVRIRDVIDNVLIVEVKREGSQGNGWWEVLFYPIHQIDQIDIVMSWDDLIKKKQRKNPRRNEE